MGNSKPASRMRHRFVPTVLAHQRATRNVSALGQALNVASSLIKFPQTCLLSDRRSVYNAAAFEKLLRTERELCGEGLTAESVDGARKFLSGIGRHGKSYDLKEKPQKHWEIE